MICCKGTASMAAHVQTQQLHDRKVQIAGQCTGLSVIPQELEAAKAAADEQQRSQSANAEARHQLQRTFDERAAALEVAQQVARLIHSWPAAFAACPDELL